MQAPVLDQKQEQYGGGGFVGIDRQVAQTFVPSVSGQLVSVDVYPDWWTQPPPSIEPLRLRISGTVNGKPDGNYVMGGVTLPVRNNWTSVSLREFDIWLDAGTTYALWFTSDDPTLDKASMAVAVNWRPDMYAAGQALELRTGEDWKPWKIQERDGPTADVMFRTFMEVPDPGESAVLCAAASALLLRRRCATVDSWVDPIRGGGGGACYSPDVPRRIGGAMPAAGAAPRFQFAS